MTRADLWLIYTTKNPKMAGEDDAHITMTVRGLRKLFETSYDQGHDAGFENGVAWKSMQAQPAQPGYDSKTANIFKDLFGSKKTPFNT